MIPLPSSALLLDVRAAALAKALLPAVVADALAARVRDAIAAAVHVGGRPVFRL